MSRGGDTRFRKGQSGNPAGRPKARRPNNSAFDIIFDKTLTVTQNGVERDLTVDEALQIQTYQAALKGSKMAVRAVLKMIEKREAAIAKVNPRENRGVKVEVVASAANADKTLLILGLAVEDFVPPGGGAAAATIKLQPWLSQLAISRPGRKAISEKEQEDIRRYTHLPETLRFPRRRSK